MYEIILERDECTMCGHCVELDEEKFTFDSDDKATLVGSDREDNTDELTVEDASVYEEASDNCTGGCIEVYDEDD